MPILDGWITRAGGVRRGRIRFGGTIADVETEGPILARPNDDAPRLLPGFIDVHVHGGGGGDTMDGADGVLALARHHLAHGTTTLLPTTMTAPWPRVLTALRGVAEVRSARRVDDALPDLPGAHLEGPFISPERLGAQPPHAIPPEPARVQEVLDLDVVRVVTLAPEVEGAVSAARTFARAGVRVSVGHTRATPEEVAAVALAVRKEGGTLGFTHLYNAMGGLAGREPGIVGACFADGEAFAELILDGHHVYDTAYLAARAAKRDRLHLVTDAIRASGMPEGTSELGGQEVTVAGGAARLANGGLAGSVLTLDAALRRSVATGVPLADASASLSAVPAAYLGLEDRGRIDAGLRADLVETDARGRVTRVFVAGRETTGAG